MEIERAHEDQDTGRVFWERSERRASERRPMVLFPTNAAFAARCRRQRPQRLQRLHHSGFQGSLLICSRYCQIPYHSVFRLSQRPCSSCRKVVISHPLEQMQRSQCFTFNRLSFPKTLRSLTRSTQPLFQDYLLNTLVALRRAALETSILGPKAAAKRRRELSPGKQISKRVLTCAPVISLRAAGS